MLGIRACCAGKDQESASSDLGHTDFPSNQDCIPMQMIKLLKIPGDWKDPLYISRNVYKSAFHEGSPSGISRSLMDVLNICFHPLSLTSCLSNCTRCLRGCGAARQPALETQQVKGNYHQQRGAQHSEEGCLPRRLVEFIPKDTGNLIPKTVGCRSTAKAQSRSPRTQWADARDVVQLLLLLHVQSPAWEL